MITKKNNNNKIHGLQQKQPRGVVKKMKKGVLTDLLGFSIFVMCPVPGTGCLRRLT